MLLSSHSKCTLIIGEALILPAVILDIAYALWVMGHDVTLFWRQLATLRVFLADDLFTNQLVDPLDHCCLSSCVC